MKFELRLSWYLTKKGQMVLALMGKEVNPSLCSGVFVYESGINDQIDALILISIRSHSPTKEDDGRIVFHPNKNYSTDVPTDVFVGTTSEQAVQMLRNYVLNDWISTHPIEEAVKVLHECASIDEFLKP